MIGQTKTRPQETLEFKKNKQLRTFSFSPPINLVEEGKWLLGVSSFECTNSVFSITDENNSFSITIPGHCETKSAENTSNELNRLLELRSPELHVEEIRKRGNKIKLRDNECKLSDFDTQKNEAVEDSKNVKYKDLEYLVYRRHFTYDEIIDSFDLKHISTKRTGYSLNPGIYEVSDINKTLKFVLPDNAKVNVTIDNVRLKSSLKNNQTLIFTGKSFFQNDSSFY